MPTEPDDASAAETAHRLTETNAAWQLARAWAASGRLKLQWAAWLDAPPPTLPQGLDLADRVEGMLLGLALGDALGNTTESQNPADRLRRHGWIQGYLPNRHADHRAVGLPSDDSQMAFWTLEQMLTDGRLDPVRLGEAFCSRRIFGIGKSVSEFRANWASGRPWWACGAPSAGNGALMRIAPVMLPYLKAPHRDLWADTLLASHLTHDHLLSNVSSVAFVHLLWHAIGLRTAPPPQWWIDTWLWASEPLAQGHPSGRFVPRSDRPPGI